MKTKKLIELYSQNNISEANKLLEAILLEKIEKALEEKKEQIDILEGDVKVANKKKKKKLEVRAGRSVGAVSAKHVGRNLFRSMQPNQLKSILATEEIEPLDEAKPEPYSAVHKKLSDAGFTIVHQKGSHIKYRHAKTGRSIPVVHHDKEVSVGIVRQVNDLLKEIGSLNLQTEQFRSKGFHSKFEKGLKKHLRITHPIQKQRRNRINYKSLHNKLDRK